MERDDPQQITRRLESALDWAREAGRLILRSYQRSDLDVDLKEDRSPVTAADRGAEELLRERIAETFPGDGVLGEEFGEKASSSGFRWILDPIDGTKSFTHGVPLFGTLIGIEFGDRVPAGICRFPALDEVVYAAEDRGAWWQQGEDSPRPARVSPVSRMPEALFCTTTLTGWETIGRQDAFEALCHRAGIARGWGDCYGHMLVATGRAEVMVDPEMNVWDAAALLPILQEAGGHFVDWSGRPSVWTGNGVSVNEALKDEVLQVLQSGSVSP